METMAVLELRYALALVTTAGAFGVLAWCMTAFRPQRGYIVPALVWLANLLLYSLVVPLRLDGVAAFLGPDILHLWAEVIRFQGAITVLFISAWMIAEGLSFFHRGGHPA